jgi:hypothetical protein
MQGSWLRSSVLRKTHLHSLTIQRGTEMRNGLQPATVCRTHLQPCSLAALLKYAEIQGILARLQGCKAAGVCGCSGNPVAKNSSAELYITI